MEHKTEMTPAVRVRTETELRAMTTLQLREMQELLELSESVESEVYVMAEQIIIERRGKSRSQTI